MKIVNATFFTGNLLAKVDKDREENFHILKDNDGSCRIIYHIYMWIFSWRKSNVGRKTSFEFTYYDLTSPAL